MKRDHRSETARDHLVERVATGVADETAGAALAALGRADLDDTDSLFVVDAERRLLGVVGVRDLLRAGPELRLGQLMAAAGGVAVRPEMDQEAVATRALRHRIIAVPVVESGGRFLGVSRRHVRPRASLATTARRCSSEKRAMMRAAHSASPGSSRRRPGSRTRRASVRARSRRR
jgi:CBS domain-containing protein